MGVSVQQRSATTWISSTDGGASDWTITRSVNAFESCWVLANDAGGRTALVQSRYGLERALDPGFTFVHWREATFTRGVNSSAPFAWQRALNGTLEHPFQWDLEPTLTAREHHRAVTEQFRSGLPGPHALWRAFIEHCGGPVDVRRDHTLSSVELLEFYEEEFEENEFIHRVMWDPDADWWNGVPIWVQEWLVQRGIEPLISGADGIDWWGFPDSEHCTGGSRELLQLIRWEL